MVGHKARIWRFIIIIVAVAVVVVTSVPGHK